MQKKIIFISPSLGKGGAENQLVKLAVFLKNQNYNVKIVTLLQGNDFESVLKTNNIELIVTNFKSIKGFFTFFTLFKKEKPDLIIAFMFSANIIARVLKVLYHTPIITSVRANVMSSLYRLLYKLTYKIDTVSTFNSHFSYNQFIADSIAVKEKSIIINNGILIDKNIDKINFDIDDVASIISIAHFRSSKDYPTLFKSIKIVKEKGYKVKLTVLGNVFDQTWPNNMIKELGIEDEVEIVGFTQDTVQYLNKSDFLVLSSFLEGTPNAILEGMSSKLPIIASNIPGNDFVINESGGGYLFELSNSKDLALKIIEMIEIDAAKRKILGENGFSFVNVNYELSNIHVKWHSIIKRALKK